MNTFSPAFSVLAPESIAWDFFLQSDVLSSIRSKKKRKILTKTFQTLQDENIEVVTQSVDSLEEFHRWAEFYTKVQEAKGYKNLVTDEWYLERKETRKVELLILKKADQWLGAKMYSYDDEQFKLAYKSSLGETSHLPYGLYLDYLSFLRAAELGYTRIWAGKTKNFFGVLAKLSQFDYKVSLGMIPRPAIGSPIIRQSFQLSQFSGSQVIFCLGEVHAPRWFFSYQDSLELVEQIKHDSFSRPFCLIPCERLPTFFTGAET